MQKPRSYRITGLRQDQTGTTVEESEAQPSLPDPSRPVHQLGDSVRLLRAELLRWMKLGVVFYVSYLADDDLVKERVIVEEVAGCEYIKTRGDGKARDGLSGLPLFSG